jgi:hypothetical protein
VDLKAILGYKDKCRLGTRIELSKVGFVWIFEDHLYLRRIKRTLQCYHLNEEQVKQRVFYARLLP